MPKNDKNFEFKVYNLGNQIDFMKVGVTDSAEMTLKKAGFTINLPAVKVQLTHPNTQPNVRSDGYERQEPRLERCLPRA